MQAETIRIFSQYEFPPARSIHEEMFKSYFRGMYPNYYNLLLTYINNNILSMQISGFTS